MPRLDLSHHVNVHEIEIRARLCGVSDFYTQDFASRAANDIMALIAAAENLAQEAIEAVDAAERDRDEAEARRVEYEGAAHSAEQATDEARGRVADLEYELKRLERRLADTEAAAARPAVALTADVERLQRELSEARERIKEMAGHIEMTGGSVPEPKMRRRRAEDPSMVLDFDAATKAAKSSQKKPSGRCKRQAEQEATRAQIELETSGEARGFRYAIECDAGWVGPHHRPGPHVHDDCCTHAEPVIYEGDQESAQARAGRHRERNRLGGATHHSPLIVPESEIPRRAAARGWTQKSA